MTTTIRIHRETKQELEDLGKKNQTFDDIIQELIHTYNKQFKSD